MTEYFIHFAIAHKEFRIPELLSVCECLSIAIKLPDEESERDVERAFMVVRLDGGDDDAKRISQRCILVRLVVFASLARPFSNFISSRSPHASVFVFEYTFDA
jgi:hypothetical protein